MSAVLAGPKGVPILGLLPRFRENILGVLSEAGRNYGAVTPMPLLRFRCYLVNSPDFVQHVLQNNAANYHKGANLKPLAPLLGQGLVTSEDELWKSQRRLIQPSFHPTQIRGHLPLFQAEANSTVAKWLKVVQTGSAIEDVGAEMTEFALKVVIKGVLGAELGEDLGLIGEHVSRVLGLLTSRIRSTVRFPAWIPTPENRGIAKSLAILDRAVLRILEHNISGAGGQNSVVSSILQAQKGAPTSEVQLKQLRDEVMTFFLAGHETTANSLTFTLYLLAQHRNIQDAVRAEIRMVLGDRKVESADFPKLKLVSQVLQEAMRLYPPIFLISRSAKGPDRLGDLEIAPGDLLMLSAWAMHRDPRIWNNPEEFDPHRFSPENVATRHRFAYFPFGGGPRTCIGNHFAATEATVMLCDLLRNFEFEALPNSLGGLLANVTMRPQGGLDLRIRKVEGLG